MTIQRKRQLGAFLMTRWVLLMLILVAMLIVPIWLKKGSDDKQKERAKAETAANSGQAAPTAAASTTATSTAVDSSARPIGFGLTFAVASAQAPLPSISQMSCHGQPAPTDKPHKESCNPYEGDTSCRTVLPVLCINTGTPAKLDGVSGDPPLGWTAGTLGATTPVMGALLESRQAADGRCEKELSSGWRMADFHAGGGWNVSGRPGSGLFASGATRYWTAINDSTANCWDSKP